MVNLTKKSQPRAKHDIIGSSDDEDDVDEQSTNIHIYFQQKKALSCHIMYYSLNFTVGTLVYNKVQSQKIIKNT